MEKRRFEHVGVDGIFYLVRQVWFWYFLEWVSVNWGHLLNYRPDLHQHVVKLCTH